MLAHIVCDQGLYTAIVAETQLARQENGTFDVQHLTSRCPLLSAVWFESLRLYNVAAVARNTEQTTVIGSKKIRAGTQVMGPFRFFHLSSRIFGHDPLSFNAERWLRNKDLANTKGFHPFGGGKTHCPGRVIAKQEVCLFVATVLARFELEPLSAIDSKTRKHLVPSIAEHKPALTALDPMEDLLVRVRRR